MSELIVALEQERVQLESSLATDPRFRKLQHIRELLALYAPTSSSATFHPRPQVNGDARQPRERLSLESRKRLSTKTSAMEHEVSDLLRDKVQLHRSVILAHLNAKGIMGGEKDQIAHLASFLSDRRHLYVSDGRGNFRLAEQDGGREGEHESGQPLSGPADPDGNVAQTDRAPGF
jgi:hypothetical protein